MLKTLKDLLDSLIPSEPGADPQAAEHGLQLATAVMLVEVMRADASFHAGEREAVLIALRDTFMLSADEAVRLGELAEATAQRATDLYAFTSRINERFEMPQKVRMVEHMWRVAYADGHLNEHEAHRRSASRAARSVRSRPDAGTAAGGCSLRAARRLPSCSDGGCLGL